MNKQPKIDLNAIFRTEAIDYTLEDPRLPEQAQRITRNLKKEMFDRQRLKTPSRMADIIWQAVETILIQLSDPEGLPWREKMHASFDTATVNDR